MPSSAVETACGICRKAITQPRMLDTPMRNTTMPLILALSTTMSQKDFERDVAVADAEDQRSRRRRHGGALGGAEHAGDDAADDDHDQGQGRACACKVALPKVGPAELAGRVPL